MTPMLDLFKVPPTDFSIASRRKVPIHPFTTGPSLSDRSSIGIHQSERERIRTGIETEESRRNRTHRRRHLQPVSGQQLFPLALQTDQRAFEQHAHQSADGHVRLRLQGPDRHGVEFRPRRRRDHLETSRVGQRTRSAHRSTHRQSVGRDARRSSGPARVATVRPQADERGIRSVREQDARVAIQTHDRSVSPK